LPQTIGGAVGGVVAAVAVTFVVVVVVLVVRRKRCKNQGWMPFNLYQLLTI